MNRLIEIILGLKKGFLASDGEFHIAWNPQWPGQSAIGASAWNILLAIVALLLVFYVYRREGRTRKVRIVLGVVRGALLALLITLLNRPVLTLTQTRTEPSVLAVMIDDSISMRVKDAGDATPQTRLDAVRNLLGSDDQQLLRALAKIHQIKLYSFDADARGLNETPFVLPADAKGTIPGVNDLLAKLAPSGQNTQVAKSIRTVLDDLQGQRLAGIVVLTDGRDTPAQPLASTLAALKDFGVKVFPVAVGTDKPVANLSIQSVVTEESAFKGDIVNVKASVRATGIPPGQQVTVRLKDKKTGLPIMALDGGPVLRRFTPAGDAPTDVELQFKSDTVGTMDLDVVIDPVPNELDELDNARAVQVAILDAQINVLYVDGYPRWDYRNIKNEMIRDKTVNISCLLTSADQNFRQEGDPPVPDDGPDKGKIFPGPITRFPDSIEELMPYDVVLIGDVDARQFSDRQLQALGDYVSKRGGGFGMVAGPQFSPSAYRNTPIEAILPVQIARTSPDDVRGSITQGFRIALTKEGTESSIFRFFADRAQNDRYFKEQIQPIFWYCHGVTVKQGVGEVYAEHPTETSPDGRKAPLLVFGRYGAGRTMFSAIDDSWRWRFYTGESVFDTYWVQQLRQLSRGKKLGQRRVTMGSDKPAYDLGEQVRLTLHVLDPSLLTQLPDQIRVDLTEASGLATTQPTSGPTTGPSIGPAGNPVRQETFVKQEGQTDTYVASFTADRAGRFIARLPAVAAGLDPLDLPLEVNVPRLELAEPQVDRVALTRLASETTGQTIEFAACRATLPTLIPSAEKIIPVETGQPLWDSPLALVLFVILITTEWVARKLQGML